MRASRILLAAALFLALPGCGAVAYSVVILRANGAFRDAKIAGAEEKDPYHYYRAQAYLEKAKEEAGYSDYQPALKYGRVAYQSSKEALKASQEQGQQRGPDGASEK